MQGWVSSFFTAEGENSGFVPSTGLAAICPHPSDFCMDWTPPREQRSFGEGVWSTEATPSPKDLCSRGGEGVWSTEATSPGSECAFPKATSGFELTCVRACGARSLARSLALPLQKHTADGKENDDLPLASPPKTARDPSELGSLPFHEHNRRAGLRTSQA